MAIDEREFRKLQADVRRYIEWLHTRVAMLENKASVRIAHSQELRELQSGLDFVEAVTGHTQRRQARVEGVVNSLQAGFTEFKSTTAGKAELEQAIAETGAASMKDMGKVVGALRAAYAGRMDFGRASALVKGLLPKG